jgi:photosystem II stability/assembly factor-like uncharacterized protein
MKFLFTSRRFFKPILFSVTLILLYVSQAASQIVSEDILKPVHYRSVGPTRQSGRFVDLAVYEKKPSVFYAALASGGLWKTVNNGITFEPVFDQNGVISIGDIAIDQNNPDVVWVGTGEANNSRTAYYGDGVYKSVDGGKSWKNMGLKESHHVGRIVINPTNTDIVWVAAAGHLYSDNPDRGLYETRDGGNTWKKILDVVEHGKQMGVTDVTIDPSNPEIMYAATYDKERKPWTFNAGGPGSAIYKSTDAGKSWNKLAGGLPAGVLGRIGIDVSVSNPDIIYANIENNNIPGMSFEERFRLMEEGKTPKGKEIGDEMYRSDDKGATWKKVSPDGRDIGGGPAYYYQQVRINPANPDHVYVLGIGVWMTENGGKEWITPFNFGGDNHAMWINPADPKHIILGYDHGMGISYDAGKNWYHPDFLAVGQVVAVGYDNDFPYNVYGGLQDNGSIKGPSTKRQGAPIRLEDWKTVGGGDGMYNEIDPNDSRWLYNESQFGSIARIDQVTGESKSIMAPKMDRWAWNAPIVVSPHNSKTIYHAGNKVLRSRNQGETWEEISPDLSTKDSAKMEGTGNISHCTIVTLDESPAKEGVLWAGTDDGKVWVTKDGGAVWDDLTANITGHQGYWISRVEPSNADPAVAYVTSTGLRNDDFRPFVWKTSDYGKTWISITSNLPEDESVCVIREHHNNPRLLFVGTTKSIYVSFDSATNWNKLRNNMPNNPVEDLKIHTRENDLIVATHGRSIWIADISYLQEISSETLAREIFLFQPENKVKWVSLSASMSSSSNFSGESEPTGVPFTFYLKNMPKDVKLQVLDGVRVIYETTPVKKAGITQVVWNFVKRTTDPAPAATGQGQGQRQSGRSRSGILAGPGTYTVKLIVDGKEQSKLFTIMRDDWAVK